MLVSKQHYSDKTKKNEAAEKGSDDGSTEKRTQNFDRENPSPQ